MNGTSLGEHLKRAIEANTEPRTIIRRPIHPGLKAKAVILSPELRDWLGRRAALGADIRGMHFALSRSDVTFERAIELRASIEDCVRDAASMDARITEMLTTIYIEGKD